MQKSLIIFLYFWLLTKTEYQKSANFYLYFSTSNNQNPRSSLHSLTTIFDFLPNFSIKNCYHCYEPVQFVHFQKNIFCTEDLSKLYIIAGKTLSHFSSGSPRLLPPWILNFHHIPQLHNLPLCYKLSGTLHAIMG